jgi:4-hydroxybenzoate polyprenyltransferase
MATPQSALSALTARPTLRGHFEILRVDHWFKNVFVLPGVVAALALDPTNRAPHLWLRLALGLVAICVLASGYYTLNELLDAKFDRLHSTKHTRAAAAGRVHRPLAYLQCVALMAAGLALGAAISWRTAAALAVLAAFACAYNIPPVRTKDVRYLDVLTESVNNPLRLLLGWYIAGAVLIPPALLLLSYWMLGAYFMAMKRFAERREIGDAARTGAYRKSLAAMSETQLLVSVSFYAAAAMLFFGAFIMRYRLELLLSFPFLAWVMAQYLAVGMQPHSPAQAPERLWREPALMIPVAFCTIAMLLCLWQPMPWLHRLTEPTIATQQ